MLDGVLALIPHRLPDGVDFRERSMGLGVDRWQVLQDAAVRGRGLGGAAWHAPVHLLREHRVGALPIATGGFPRPSAGRVRHCGGPEAHRFGAGEAQRTPAWLRQ